MPDTKSMKSRFEIANGPILEPSTIGAGGLNGESGAVVRFLGVVRGLEDGKPIAAIDYEAFPEMVLHQFNLIFAEAESRWPLQSIHVIHRIGVVLINEPSLWVEVIAPHRGEAFAGCQFVIDEMKRRVPIWKKAIFS